MRTLLAIVLLIACKGSEQKPPPPRVSTLPALPAALGATIDPPDAPAEFPKESPALVLWQGGGEPPRTIVSVRIWSDGTVRFRCNRRGSLPAERVVAMLDTFEKAGWFAAPPPESTPDPACITTSVQLSRAERLSRRNSSCGEVNYEVADALLFIQAVVGPDPCT